MQDGRESVSYTHLITNTVIKLYESHSKAEIKNELAGRRLALGQVVVINFIPTYKIGKVIV